MRHEWKDSSRNETQRLYAVEDGRAYQYDGSNKKKPWRPFGKLQAGGAQEGKYTRYQPWWMTDLVNEILRLAARLQELENFIGDKVEILCHGCGSRFLKKDAEPLMADPCDGCRCASALEEENRRLRALLNKARGSIELEWGEPEQEIREVLGIAPDAPI